MLPSAASCSCNLCCHLQPHALATYAAICSLLLLQPMLPPAASCSCNLCAHMLSTMSCAVLRQLCRHSYALASCLRLARWSASRPRIGVLLYSLEPLLCPHAIPATLHVLC